MTDRCSVFLTTPKLDPEDFANEEAYLEAVFESLHDSFTLTMDLIQQSADEEGIEINENDDDADWAAKRKVMQSEIENTPISILSMDYSDFGHIWLKSNTKSLKELEENLRRTALMDLPDRNPEQEAVALRDALEVISYYMRQIYVKLNRAQTNRTKDDVWFEENQFPKDSDGSAKVALIGIDRSIQAWSEVLHLLAEQEASILPILSRLENLRRLVEISFPDARAFKRPGFDDQ
jgi:hypothetical protein